MQKVINLLIVDSTKYTTLKTTSRDKILGKELITMKIRQNNRELSISEICDSLIEDAQTIFVNQTEFSEKITLNLSDYTGLITDDEITRKINEEIMDNLIAQQIRLYEDVCDENGIITSSKEQFSPIFENVTLESSNNNRININLSFNKAMVDLLT